MKRVGYIECRVEWRGDSDDHPAWDHGCSLPKGHDGPHRCDYCDEEEGS